MKYMRSCIGTAIALCVFFSANAQSKYIESSAVNKHFRLTGTISGTVPSDSIQLTVWEKLYSLQKSATTQHRQLIIPVINGKFSADLPLEKIAYCNMLLLSERWPVSVELFPFTLVEPGDDINISFKTLSEEFRYEIGIAGKGAFKWQCANHLLQQEATADREVVQQARKAFQGHVLDSSNYFRSLEMNFNVLRQLAAEQEKYLRLCKSNLSAFVFDIMLANAKGKIWQHIFEKFYDEGFRHFLLSPNSQLDAATRKKFEERCWIFYWRNLAELKITGIGDDRLVFAPGYIQYITYRQSAELRMLMNNQFQPYAILRDRFDGTFRDHVLTNYLLNAYEALPNGDSLLTDAIELIEDSSCLSVVENLRDNQQLGTEVYNFSLPDNGGRIVQLSDFRGKVVFIDYWFTGCGACEILYKNELKPAEAIFREDTNVVFISISADKAKSIWLKSLQKGNNTSPDMVNLYTGGEGFNAEVLNRMNISSFPRVFLIDQTGRIAGNNTAFRRKETIINAIRALLQKD